MSRGKIRRTMLSLLLAACSLWASAESFTVTVEEAPNSGEQLAMASRLVGQLPDIDDPNASAAAGKVIGSLQVVLLRWPEDREAVLSASLLQADIMLKYKWSKNAVTVLENALPVAQRLRRDSLVQYRLALSFAQLGDGENALKHAVLAVRPDALQALDARDRANVLRDSARVFDQFGEPRESADCLRRAGRLQELSELERAVYLVQAGKASVRAGRRDLGKSDARECEPLIHAAKSRTGVTPSDLSVLTSIEKQVAALLR